MQITIEKIVYPGKCLGRGEDGIVTFVEGGLPGETVEIEVTRKKKTFREGRITAVITPSGERISPQCPSFGQCGGCSFQHTGYPRQLKAKEDCVRELLNPLAIPVGAIIPSPEQWGYRNKMEFSFAQSPEGLMIGLHRKGEFNRYFAVPPCFIADADVIPALEAVLSFARGSGMPSYDKRTHQGFYRHLVLRKGKRTGEILVNLVTNRDQGVTAAFFDDLAGALDGKVSSLYWTINSKQSDAVIADELILLRGVRAIEDRMLVKGREYRFSVSPFSFFQTNTLAAEKLYEIVADLLAGEPGDTLLDLYCGTGTIGIVLSPFVGKVLGVEQVPDAVLNAEENKRINGVDNISFVAGSVEKWIKHGEIPPFNALVLDPPRGGLSGKVVDFIARTLPDKIVYVSCNPSTLARDLKDIMARAPYSAGTVIPVDMFPQTFHVEAAVALRKKTQ